MQLLVSEGMLMFASRTGSLKEIIHRNCFFPDPGGCLSVTLCITRSFNEGNQFLLAVVPVSPVGEGGGGEKGGCVCDT